MEPRGQEIFGIPVLVDDGSNLDTLFGISRTTTPRWKAKVDANGGVNRALTLALMQKGFTHVEKTGLGPTLILTTFELRDKYVTLLVAEKRYVNTLKLDGGFNALEFNGKPLLPDEQAKHNQMDFLTGNNQRMHHR